jgi:signal transduction histidine kinase
VQLRDYARADRATMRPIAISDFVLGDRSQLEAIAGPAIELVFDVETPGPTVSANPLELRQLLLNLVINASEAIRPTAGPDPDPDRQPVGGSRAARDGARRTEMTRACTRCSR